MLRRGVLLPIGAIVCGFAAAGFLVDRAHSMDVQAPQQAATTAANALRNLPDPLQGAVSDRLLTVGEKTLAGARNAAALLASIKGPAILEADAVATDPSRLQDAATLSARQLQALALPSSEPDALPAHPGQIQFAGRSLSNWLTTLSNSGQNPQGDTVVIAATPLPAPAPVATAPLSAPSATMVEPAPVAKPAQDPQATVTTVPAQPSPTNDKPTEAVAAQANPATAAPEPMAPAAENGKPDAGSVADTLNQKFNDLMKSLTGSEAQPADTAKAQPGPAPNASPADAAAAPQAPASGEPPVVVAEAVSDLVFSDISFVPAADGNGVITLSGRGLPGRKLQLFLDDKQVGNTSVGDKGRWLLDVTQPLPLGEHQARAELLGDDGKATHSAIFMFARQAAIAAGGETTIVPLAKMATAPAEPAVPAKTAEATPVPNVAEVIKIVPPAEMAKDPPAAPVVAAAPAATRSVPVAKPAIAAKPLRIAKPRYAQARPKPVRRQIARIKENQPKTSVVNVVRGSKIERVRVPDGILRSSVGRAVQPRRARQAQVRALPRQNVKAQPRGHARKRVRQLCYRTAVLHKHPWREHD